MTSMTLYETNSAFHGTLNKMRRDVSKWRV